MSILFEKLNKEGCVFKKTTSVGERKDNIVTDLTPEAYYMSLGANNDQVLEVEGYGYRHHKLRVLCLETGLVQEILVCFNLFSIDSQSPETVYGVEQVDEEGR